MTGKRGLPEWFNGKQHPELWAFLLLAIISLTYTDYGITWDEHARKEFGYRVLLWYSSFFQIDAATLDVIRNIHGGCFEIIAQFAASVAVLTTGGNLFETRHFINALFGFGGVVYAYRLGGLVAGRTAGGLAAVFLVMTPRYYGHMFNNPKDIPFAAFFVISLYYMIRVYRELPGISKDIVFKLGVSIGLAMGVRVGGIILYGYFGLLCGAWLLCSYLIVPDGRGRQRFFAGNKQWVRVAGAMAAVMGISWSVMLMCWPWAQVAPFSRPLQALSQLSDFPHDARMLFKGEFIVGEALPWDYIPTWFAMVLPEFYFIAAISGVIAAVSFFRNYRQSSAHLKKTVEIAFLVFVAAFPAVMIVVKGSVLYDGVRHLLFIVPILAVLCAVSVIAYAGSDAAHLTKKCAALCMMGFFGLTLYDMITLHPYQTVYFNRMVAGGVSNGVHRFESDYWGNAYKEGAEWLHRHYSDAKDKTPVVGTCGFPSEIVSYYLNQEEYIQKDIRKIRAVFHLPRSTSSLASTEKRAGGAGFKVVETGVTDFRLAFTRWNCHLTGKQRLLHVVERKNTPLLYVFKR